MIKQVFKVAAVAAMLSPVSAFAADLLNDGVSALTDLIEIQGDGTAAGGGLGWNNAANTLFNENDVEYTTAGEVYLAAESNNAMAFVRAVHLGGKGSVFINTSYGYSGQCVEEIALTSALDRSGSVELITAVFSWGGVGTTTGTFLQGVDVLAVDPTVSDRSYSLETTGCTSPSEDIRA